MDTLRLFGAIGAGAALMYFLDPNTGRRRRGLVRDQVVHGVVAELRGRLDGRDVSDDTLAERVRGRIGAIAGHASAIRSSVSEGRVTLNGPILLDDVDRLLRRVRAVRGVKDVDDRLEVHAEPDNVPGLQGRPRRPRGGEVLELCQDHWSPTARLLTGAAGAVLLVSGLRRFDHMGFSIAALGLALLSRASTNLPIARTTESLGAGRHAER
jgi:hypothetical protein